MTMICRWLLRVWGFRIVTAIPHDCKKSVVAVVPHTSNWDFPLGILTRNAMETKIGFVAKDSLFKPLWGWFFTWTGGYPVDRSKKGSNYVEAIAAIFERVDGFHLSISPEGTRKKVDKLKTGFYYIAVAAKVPIILCKFDWEHREVTFREPFWPTGDVEKDMAFIYDYFRDVKGKVVENSFVPS